MATHGPAVRDYTILLIDYEPRSVEALRKTLEGAGYRVAVARDGQAGLDLFDEIQPDLTLVEGMIPKVHGFEVCRRLKRTAHGSSSPVLIITGVYRGRKYRTEAKHLYRCDGYLEKPIADEDLLRTIRGFITGNSPAAEDDAELVRRLDSVLDTPAKPTGRSSDSKPEA